MPTARSLAKPVLANKLAVGGVPAQRDSRPTTGRALVGRRQVPGRLPPCPGMNGRLGTQPAEGGPHSTGTGDIACASLRSNSASWRSSRSAWRSVHSAGGSLSMAFTASSSNFWASTVLPRR